MTRNILLASIFICCTLCGTAQQMTEQDYIRSGNKLYADSLFEKAEVEYRKALEIDPASTDALYNLGNALFNQINQTPAKAGESLEQYKTAAKLETDKERLAQIYHNMGVLLYLGEQYGESVAAYKESMRNNPHDDETRYNLAKAMYMNRQQEQQQDQQNQEQEQEQQQEQQQQQNEQQQQEQQNKEQQQEQQNQEQQNEQQQEQESQQQQNEEQISKENAEQILNALMQDEKDIQEKQKKMMQQQQGKTLDKDW
mgnify:CR=1 FL=1